MRNAASRNGRPCQEKGVPVPITLRRGIPPHHLIPSRSKVPAIGLCQTAMEQTAATKAASPHADFRAIMTPRGVRLDAQPKETLPASGSRLLSHPLPPRKLGPTQGDVFRPN